MEAEQIQFPAQLAVIAASGFLKPLQMRLESLFIAKGRAVNTGKHGVLFITAPIRARHGKQFERLCQSGAGQMRSAAQIKKFAAPVQRNGIRVDPPDDFGLVVLTSGLEQLHGVGFLHFRTDKGNVFRRDSAHLLFNRGQIFHGEGAFHIKIVVKARVDGRADGHPGVGKKALHGGGHDMGNGMAQQRQAIGIISGDRRDGTRVSGQGRGKVTESFAPG